MGTKRRKVEREAPDMGKFLRRTISNGMVRRAEAGDLEVLSELKLTRQALDTAMRAACRGLHEFGYSYSEMARELGIQKQSVHALVTRMGEDG